MLSVATRPAPTGTSFVLCDTPKRVEELFDGLQRARTYSYDCETTHPTAKGSSEDPIPTDHEEKVIGISFCWSPQRAMYLPLYRNKEGDIRCFDQPSFDAVVRDLKRELEDPSKTRRTWNRLFDDVELYRCFGIKVPIVRGDEDGMLQHHLLDEARAESGHRLKECAALYIDPAAAKYERDLDEALDFFDPHLRRYSHVPLDVIYPYGCADALYHFLLPDIFQPRLEAEGLAGLFHTISMPTQHAVVQMHETGLPASEDQVGAASAKLAVEIEALTRDIWKLAGFEFDVGSAGQLSDALFNRMKLPVKKATRGKDGYFSTAKEVLAELEDDHAIIPLVQRHRRAVKLKGTYVDGLRNFLVGGRYYQEFKVHGTVSGRFTERLVNLLPRGEKGGDAIKGLFVAPPGWWFVFRDLCLAAGTGVQTLDGTKPIEDVRPGDKVFTFRDGRVAWGEVTRTAAVGRLDCLRVTFDNGRSVVASREHKWPVKVCERCGQPGCRSKRGHKLQIQATRSDALRVGDSIVPLRRQLVGGRSHLWAWRAIDYTKEHLLVAEAVLGPRPVGHDVHHLNEDVDDNRPGNLEYRDATAHKSEHGRARYAVQDHTKRLDRLRHALKHERRSYRGVGNPNFGKLRSIERACLTCKSTFYRPPSREGLYCSRVCYHEARRHGLNCRVVSIEPAGLVDCYTICVDPDHNYALAAGVFTFNSQIELRVAAHVSQDPIMCDGYRNGGPGFDLHAATAIRMFNLQIPDGVDPAAYVKETYKPYRSISKNIGFGTLYGATARRIMALINADYPEMQCSVEKAQEFIDTYFKTMVGLGKSIKDIQAFTHLHGYIASIFGRRRRLPDARLVLPEDRSAERPDRGPLRWCYGRECPSLTFDLQLDLAEHVSGMQSAFARDRLRARKENARYLIATDERVACADCEKLVPCMYTRERRNRDGRVKAAYRQAFNFVIQSSAADYTNLSLSQIVAEIERSNLRSRAVLQIHDALGFLVPDEEIETMINLTRDRMEHATPLSLPIVSDLTVVRSWGDENMKVPKACKKCKTPVVPVDTRSVPFGQQSRWRSIIATCTACGWRWNHDHVFTTELS